MTALLGSFYSNQPKYLKSDLQWVGHSFCKGSMFTSNDIYHYFYLSIILYIGGLSDRPIPIYIGLFFVSEANILAHDKSTNFWGYSAMGVGGSSVG